MTDDETPIEAAEPAAPVAERQKRPYHWKRQLTPRIPKEKPMAEAQPSQPSKKTAMITYIPQDPTDPPDNTMGGIRFKANVPTEVPYTKTIKQLLGKKITTPDGKVAIQHSEVEVPLPDVLRGNPWFDVDGVRAERVKPHARMPEDADQYRGYCINWISVSMSADSMDKRWVGEESLRQRCGVSAADIAFLRPFFEARRVECAELDKQRAA